MKKKISFPNYLSKFSLQKQLALIFMSLILLIIVILVPVIDNNLNQIVDDEMYSVLNSSQDNFKDYNFSIESKVQEKQIYHMYYNSATQKVYPAVTITNGEAEKMIDVFKNGLFTMLNSKKKIYRSKGEYRGKTMYYQIQQADDDENSYIISLMYSDYSKGLMSSFRQQVIYIFYTALAVVALITFVWVSSLIKPLKLIKDYIDAIKEDKESTLNIDRNDEIGVVSRGLVDMKAQLDKQNRIKEEMIHNISHDLKTPIALIKTYSQSVKDDVYPYGDKNSSMDVILENAERLGRKVRSLLYLNRLDYLSDKDTNQTVLMKELIEHITLQLTTMHPEIELLLELENVTFIGDEEHWRICVENIIDNAYRYVDSKIVVTLKEEYLEIYNDGDSIDEENKEDLFQPYEKGVKGQFGLGLSIVYKTVNLYGYQVEAINRDKGVSFVITKKSI